MELEKVKFFKKKNGTFVAAMPTGEVVEVPKHLDQTTLPVTQKNEKCSSKAIKSEIYLISSKEEKKAIEGSENTKPNRLDVSINTDKRDSKIQRIPHTTEQMKEVISQEEERAGVLSNESNKQSLNTMESDSVDSLGGVNSATDLRIQLNLKKDNPPRKNVRFVQQQNLIPRMSNNLLKSSQSTVPNYTPEMLEAIDLSETTASPPIDSVEAINFSSLRLRKILQLFGWEIDRRRNRQSTPNILDSELVERKKKWDDLFNSNILEDLMVNLNYCANVMESVYIEETRRLMNEDDILSEVEPDIVPTEVRDWLAMTFTRSMSNIKKKPERKHNFKIIANVIRAGLVVDKMFRRMSSSATYSGCNSAVESLLKQQAHIWGTDVFQLNNLSDNHSLKAMSLYLLNKTRLTSKLKIDNGKLNTFLLAIEEGYSKHGNPYHNLVHAADILQTTYYILTDSSLIHWLTEVEKFAVLFAAIIHDYEHTGTTNNFHVQTNSDFALLYNDRAVLENHHISSAFRLFSDPNLNIVASLSREQYREFRDLVIEMVLATDMSLHFQQVKTMTNLLSLPENLEKIDKSKALSLILHTADISHPAKRWELHHKWTLRLIEEFFKQGDKEFDLNIPYSPLCDRHTTHVAKSQIGFINYIVEPSFNLLSDMLETIIPLAEREESSPDSLSVDTNNDSKIIDKEAKSCSASVNVFGITWFRHGPLPKPWADELKQNKIIWTERAEKEDEQKLMESKEKAEDNGPGSTDDPPEVSEENEAELKK
ncbi:hypothetical protein SNEBB_006308 [Seison nebaliae]|nr:hypothetical protein SNEBB_006308 [Seison nebaliae]